MLLDVGAGPGVLGTALRRAFSRLTVIGVDPGASSAPDDRRHLTLRARAEDLPLAAGTCDLAVALSSMRHVRDRIAAFGELRRVVRPGGALHVVELDPRAPRGTARAHARGLGHWTSRLTFRAVVLRCAPPAEAMVEQASAGGWSLEGLDRDVVQPVYRLRLR